MEDIQYYNASHDIVMPTYEGRSLHYEFITHFVRNNKWLWINKLINALAINAYEYIVCFLIFL